MFPVVVHAKKKKKLEDATGHDLNALYQERIKEYVCSLGKVVALLSVSSYCR